jgi:hypothetical protein
MLSPQKTDRFWEIYFLGTAYIAGRGISCIFSPWSCFVCPYLDQSFIGLLCFSLYGRETSQEPQIISDNVREHQRIKELEKEMGKVRRLVLDTLKPHDPSIVEMAKIISDIEGVGAVNVSIYEMDRKVENAKVTIEGDDIPYIQIQTLIEELGGAIHSVDEVVAGKIIIDDAVTLQD